LCFSAQPIKKTKFLTIQSCQLPLVVVSGNNSFDTLEWTIITRCTRKFVQRFTAGSLGTKLNTRSFKDFDVIFVRL
jgi:hypothetical protein